MKNHGLQEGESLNIRSVVFALAAMLALPVFQAAHAQVVAAATANTRAPLSEQDIRNVLIWNSPWEGRTSTPGRLYSYRTIFLVRRDALVAEVLSYSTNQRSDSVVNIRDGRLNWQDSNGADVNVALGELGDLVGTARSQNAELPIVLKPRP